MILFYKWNGWLLFPQLLHRISIEFSYLSTKLLMTNEHSFNNCCFLKDIQLYSKLSVSDNGYQERALELVLCAVAILV